MRKITTSYSTRKKYQRSYADGLKDIGKNLKFAAIFMGMSRRWALPEGASIHRAKMALKKIHKREDKDG